MNAGDNTATRYWIKILLVCCPFSVQSFFHCHNDVHRIYNRIVNCNLSKHQLSTTVLETLIRQLFWWAITRWGRSIHLPQLFTKLCIYQDWYFIKGKNATYKNKLSNENWNKSKFWMMLLSMWWWIDKNLWQRQILSFSFLKRFWKHSQLWHLCQRGG